MLLKQTAIQTVENISLLNDRARPENSFFFRQGIRPTRSPFHIIMAQIMLTFNFQLIFKSSIKNDILYIIYLIRPIIFFDHRYDCFQMWDNV